MKATLLGAGALGSHVAPLVRNVSDLQLKIVDFDKVEAKNTLSQWYGAAGVSRNKASALLLQLKAFWPSMNVQAAPVKLTADNVEVLLGGADLVVDCFDNAASRLLVQSYVRKRALPCLHGAVSADGAYGVSAWDEVFVVDAEGAPGAATCEGGEHLPFIAQVSAAIAASVTRFAKTGAKDSFRIWPNGVKPW